MKPSLKPTLSQFVGVSDGMDRDEALKRAELHVAVLREKIESGIRDYLAELSAVVSGESRALSLSDIEKVKKAADGIYCVAENIGQKHLGIAAYLLCELLQIGAQSAANEKDAIVLHFNAMRLLLNQLGLSEVQRDEIVEQLRQLVCRVTEKYAAL